MLGERSHGHYFSCRTLRKIQAIYVLRLGSDSQCPSVLSNSLLQHADSAAQRTLAKGDLTQAVLAERFGLSRSNVKSILDRRSWKHIWPYPTTTDLIPLD